MNADCFVHVFEFISKKKKFTRIFMFYLYLQFDAMRNDECFVVFHWFIITRCWLSWRRPLNMINFLSFYLFFFFFEILYLSKSKARKETIDLLKSSLSIFFSYQFPTSAVFVHVCACLMICSLSCPFFVFFSFLFSKEKQKKRMYPHINEFFLYLHEQYERKKKIKNISHTTGRNIFHFTLLYIQFLSSLAWNLLAAIGRFLLLLLLYYGFVKMKSSAFYSSSVSLRRLQMECVCVCIFVSYQI